MHGIDVDSAPGYSATKCLRLQSLPPEEILENGLNLLTAVPTII